MRADLCALLDRHTPLAETSAVWGNGQTLLRLTTYLSEECPPLDLITSVRGVVVGAGGVLVVRDPGGTHILPGGRREPGETLEETLRREVLEETGWTITGLRRLGFTHLRTLSPQLPEYRHYPYPDFLWVVYLAAPDAWRPEAREIGGYELEAGFRPLAEVERLDLTPGERVYLAAARRV